MPDSVLDGHDDRQNILVRSRLRDLDAEITRVLERNVTLKEQLSKYQIFENWDGTGTCPLCHHHISQSHHTKLPSHQSTSSTVDRSGQRSKENIVAVKSESVSPKNQSERHKLRLRETQKRKRHYYTNSDTSPDENRPANKRQPNIIFGSDEEKPILIGRVLVPETCPNDSLDLAPSTDVFVPETEAHTERSEIPEKVRKRADTDIVHRHGLTSQIDSVNPEHDDPEITSTPVSEVSRSKFVGRTLVTNNKNISPLWESDNDSIASEVSQQITQVRKPPQRNEKPDEERDTTIEEEKSSCLFDLSDNIVLKEPNQPKTDIFTDDDDWLFAVKDETQKKRDVLSELRNISNVSIASTPSPSLVDFKKAYRQQTIVGMLKKPKVPVSNLNAFDGGMLNKVSPKRSPWKIRTDENRSPVYSGEVRPSPRFHDSNTSLDVSNRPMPRAGRPPLVRQNAVDYGDEMMQDSCASVKFGAGPKRLVATDSELPRDTTRLKNTNESEMEFDDVMNDLELDLDEKEHVFRKPEMPAQDLNETFESSFDRLPSKKADVGYVYHQTDRRKAIRQKMEAFDCPQCQAFFANLPEEERHKRMTSCSRHRATTAPPSTPPGFWDVGFPETQERKKLQEGNELREEDRARVRRKRRYEMRDPNKEREERRGVNVRHDFSDDDA